MNILHSRKARIGLLLLICASTLFYVRTQFLHARQSQSSGEEDIPPEGRPADIETNGTIPGNPMNAIKDMKQLRKLITLYQRKHGRFPEHGSALLLDVLRTPQEYGYSSSDEVWSVFGNPDCRYSDNVAERQRPNRSMPYYILSQRPDGTPVGGPKTAGQKDILIFTPLYYHGNVRHFKGERSTSNPVGFFLVMWDDEKIEKIPYYKQLYVQLDKNKGGTEHSFGMAFPGQAGVPSNALTYDQFHQKLGAKRGPRGKAGAKGLPYDKW